ncbi:MAG TPA: PPC domain-containing protein [Phycisphaerales bacterium]|nr:PPC domain-containing protein [Phycisphaerales bacterium]
MKKCIFTTSLLPLLATSVLTTGVLAAKPPVHDPNAPKIPASRMESKKFEQRGATPIDSKGVEGGTAGTATTCTYQADINGLTTGLVFNGLTNNTYAMCNLYATGGDCTLLKTVVIQYGEFDTPGRPVTVFVMSDPNQDGDPADGVVLASVDTVTSQEFTGNDVVVDVPNVQLSAGFFFVGYRINAALPPGGNNFPLNIDVGAPLTFQSIFAIDYTVGDTQPFDGPFATGGGEFNMSFQPPFASTFVIRAGGDVGQNCNVGEFDCVCEANTATSGASATNIDIDDLTNVILSWGTDNHVAGGPRPIGDVAPQNATAPDGDCKVNINDLTSVILQWGACPAHTGACCTTSGTCSVTTAAACTSPSFYVGDCVTCADAACAPFPVNDECEGASLVAPLHVGTQSISTVTATADLIGGMFCVNDFGWINPNGLWYQFSDPTGGHVTISTSGGSTAIDTLLTANSGTCTGTLTEIACNDDISTADVHSSITFSALAGQVYLIRIGSYVEDTFTVNVSIAPFNNDLCADVTPVGSLPATVLGNLTGATTGDPTDPSGVCGTIPLTGSGRWYSCVGTGNTITASLCGSSTAGSGAFNSRLHVFCNELAADDCSSLFCVTAADNAAPVCLQHAAVTFPSTNARIYRMLVSEASVTSTKAFQLIVSSNGTPATGQALCNVPPPVNDSCSAPTVLSGTLPITANGTNLQATPAKHDGGALVDDGLPAAGPSCHWNNTPTDVHNTVWYSYTPTVTQTYIISLCTTSTATTPILDTHLSVWTGACGSLTQVLNGCNDDGCTNASPYYSILPAIAPAAGPAITLNSGTTYRICVANPGGWAGEVSGPFVISITH